MFDLLTIEEDIEAALFGWGVNYVYDLQSRRWTVQILPLTFLPPTTNADIATSQVVGLARSGHLLAIKALRLVAAAPVAPPKGNK